MMYSKKVMDHFKNPRNQGQLKNPDAVGEMGNPSCGDVMKIYLKINPASVKKEEGIIKDIKFETLGCAAAIAVSSSLTEMVKGKTLKQALKITKDQIVKKLGGLPEPKVHCSMLGVEALHAAIKNFQDKNKIKNMQKKQKKSSSPKTEEKIKKALEKIRPSLQMDGGDVELVAWDEKKKEVRVHLLGRCSSCPMAHITLKEGIAKEIIKAVPEVKDVVSV